MFHFCCCSASLGSTPRFFKLTWLLLPFCFNWFPWFNFHTKSFSKIMKNSWRFKIIFLILSNFCEIFGNDLIGQKIRGNQLNAFLFVFNWIFFLIFVSDFSFWEKKYEEITVGLSFSLFWDSNFVLFCSYVLIHCENSCEYMLIFCIFPMWNILFQVQKIHKNCFGSLLSHSPCYY